MIADNWTILDTYFRDVSLVKHHLESYNCFYKSDIRKIIKDRNPIHIVSGSILDGGHKSQCNLYIGGKEGNNIYFGKPVIYDSDGKERLLLPNEARLRNMTYAMSISYDIEIEVINILDEFEEPSLEGREFLTQFNNGKIDILLDENQIIGGEKKKRLLPISDLKKLKTTAQIASQIEEEKLNSIQNIDGHRVQKYSHFVQKVLLGNFPIMVQSDFCVLHGLTRENMFSMGECKNDPGGYFIINGKEMSIICHERIANNMLFVGARDPERDYPEDDPDFDIDFDEEEDNEMEFLYWSEIISLSDDYPKVGGLHSVKMIAPTNAFTNKQLVVSVPNIDAPIPLFIIFRALGILSDKDIINMCLLDLEKYRDMIDLFIPSVHDSSQYCSQESCLRFIVDLPGKKSQVFDECFLPHIGKRNCIHKAYYLGYMVFRLLSLHQGIDKATDCDDIKYRRVDLVGNKLCNLFNKHYETQNKKNIDGFQEILSKNQSQYEGDLMSLITINYNNVFKKNKVLENGIMEACNNPDYAKPLDRSSFNSMISEVREMVSLDMTAYNYSDLVDMLPQIAFYPKCPSKIHSSEWGFIDPIDRGTDGFQKHLAMSCEITIGYSKDKIIQWIFDNTDINSISDYRPSIISKMSKVFVNGSWIGSIWKPLTCIDKMILFRQNGLIPVYTSITFDIRQNVISIHTDGGRLCRPIFHSNYSSRIAVRKRHQPRDITLNDMITGFNIKKEVVKFDPNNSQIYKLHELYDNIKDDKNNPRIYERFITDKAILQYIDSYETENSFIQLANSRETNASSLRKYTHYEIHDSLILGVTSNQISFPHANTSVSNSSSCKEIEDACSLYHTNYQMRMDKYAHVLNYGQTPLVNTRFGEYINTPYGENVIVSIMCYTGYNNGNSVLVNEASIKRGMFQTSHFTAYETENTTECSGRVDPSIRGSCYDYEKKIGYDYSKLDSNGLLKEGCTIDDKTVLIALTLNAEPAANLRSDISIIPDKGQVGKVYKSYITDGHKYNPVAKVGIIEQYSPVLGDKLSSRNGLYGTIGEIMKEVDMPFTKQGLRPDIIINPQTILSQISVGQLIESITGKACALFGGFADCTAFNQNSYNVDAFNDIFLKAGFHSNGNEILYDGITGQQIESNIFIGPTYYMRSKHMLKNKIDFRRQGSIDQLTRQPSTQEKLSISEIDCHSIVSYGATNFLTESMMERGDKYFIAICNKSGMTAVYNPSKNLFLSPIIDGPIQYNGLQDDNLNIQKISQFGRSFSVIQVPYTLKLLVQELGCMNLQLRIITDENINQLLNMSKSIHKKKETKHFPETTLRDSVIKENKSIVNSVEDDWDKRNYEPYPIREIYGWTRVLSPEYKRFYWFNQDTNETTWVDPPKIVQRQEIFNIQQDDYSSYLVGDTIFYLGPTNDIPDRKWKITSINDEHITISAVDETSLILDIILDLKLMRHSNPKQPSESQLPPPPTLATTTPITSDTLITSDTPITSDSPNTPNTSSISLPRPQENLFQGGNSLHMDEIVYYKNDSKPKRQWYITSKTPLIIQTDDMDGLETNVMTLLDDNNLERPSQEEQPRISPYPGGIIFSPIIKVVNGNDNSTSDEGTSKTYGGQNDLSIKETVKDKSSEKTEPQGFLGSMIDFTKNVIIKKMI